MRGDGPQASAAHVKDATHTHHGLASESYISLTSEDPIHTALFLCEVLRSFAEKEKYYRVYFFITFTLQTNGMKNNLKGP